MRRISFRPSAVNSDRCVRVLVYERREVQIAEMLRAFRPFSDRVEILGPVIGWGYYEYLDPTRTIIEVPGAALKKRRRRSVEPRQ
jgi:hypothetical protein